ncbi:DUF185-domain-containing protein [Sistotremastrum suecicum HHB10207 ss-3]|uniref:Protein arginine methyltransferase NDUFAF7 n=1 Tax=Sistotremastrum suecicum HHB10207 ss-3 TaxID=1314776 RepID=A0A166HZ71_9AGAM|nr:DUF185-domain-containing protein [Sistotremastrum suecicum HHB10207 ss-3]
MRRYATPRYIPALTRTFSASSRVLQKPQPSRYNFNPEPSFEETPAEQALRYPTLTAHDLFQLKEQPKGVKMLTRDFIEDSLYNPNYGYFSKEAIIFSDSSPDKGFDFPSLRDANAFQSAMAESYQNYADSGAIKGPGHQVWHTPTELFKPYYGQAIAQCLISEYLLKYFPYEDFIIYEMGGGNGTLARNILDYLRDEHPEVYDRTKYNIIEISESLTKIQKARVVDVHPCARVINKSVFDWNTHEPAPCFFVALEVIDNFAHDMLRYDLKNLQPYQSIVTIDDSGDFSHLYAPVSDPLIKSFLSLRNTAGHRPALPRYLLSSPLRNIYRSLPFAPNLSPPVYIPTRLLTFLRMLRQYFPRHKLLLSDFSSLPDSIEGYNAPVVQTRLRGSVVPCSTLFVKQGYFDIFFPTDFELLRDLYELIMSRPISTTETDLAALASRTSPLMTSTSSIELGARYFFSRGRRMPVDGVISASGLPVGQRKSNVFTHKEFLQTYAQLDATRTRSGENPMLDYYTNVKFLF